MRMEKPDPKTIRDLRLMYETSRRLYGTIEYANLRPDVMNSREYHEGDIISMDLRVIPSEYYDLVTVCVQRVQVTNLGEDGAYRPRRIDDWSKEYTFAEFMESPFYQMCVDEWKGCSWDASEMDDHEVYDEDTRWGVYAHVYEHHEAWPGNWEKSGRVEAVDFSLDEDGNIDMGVSRNGKREYVYSGDVWELQRIVEEHEQMVEQMRRLKEHGIDLDNGTLSIRLWEEK